jgi:hypothetical protein
MPFCSECYRFKTCKEICKKVEKELKKGTKYQREFTVGGTKQIDQAQKLSIRKKQGRKYPRIYNDNWEIEQP